ncbi:2-amino-4-hydroxy-6-hydroxymethyldihydropteridine diphosphokinase [Nonomuraea sp. KC401]|uniref:2-amino-4-hydroxy-6-hydroxymethyldihydropteridine diphosphokinase n=1 Tax=Nonomuraea longispora TaxID=1848320 RepID=A0A4R4NH46_9ACTN|nr:MULTISPECIES: 2-amino-4-hydroxy-6-hydroxymethyldihydropteridine diphosphokinase [Nonomuraea]NBE96369.1 2-amino-4-hydroxy-6-hydroxymethyldihydropteridine diphosphokinase [Nonomuraea sp. K271]TDC08581.1 2-amino-4-hydroxy-6-hydroxymethyldihydropteridine diphosphokinase [Nonomuraea longispora]TLF68089.1 2-amino-4-hydroxy-6-hydroxymethyldihydropteridine diphosphokinase [Nonomuraea sp. KC401]
MKAVIALGSNLGARFQTLQGAVDTLFDAPGLRFVQASPVYETDPVGGPSGQRPYLNAIVIAETTLEPFRLLERALNVEDAFGRVRGERWGPRTLDVDLVAVGELVSDDPELTLPHPLAHERAFVLVPWSKADPEAVLPGRGRVADLLEGLDRQGVRLRDDLKLQRPD